MKLELRGVLPSNNVLLRMHWTKRRKLIETWAWLLKYWLIETKQNHSKFKAPVVLSLTVYRKDKRGFMDDSNLIASADKLIVDNLVKLKILVDDSEEMLTWTKPVQLIGNPERVTVEIEEWQKERT